MSRHSAVTGTLAALLFFGSSLSGFGQGSSDTVRVVKYFGYEKAIELRNETTRVVLCPQTKAFGYKNVVDEDAHPPLI